MLHIYSIMFAAVAVVLCSFITLVSIPLASSQSVFWTNPNASSAPSLGIAVSTISSNVLYRITSGGQLLSLSPLTGNTPVSAVVSTTNFNSEGYYPGMSVSVSGDETTIGVIHDTSTDTHFTAVASSGGQLMDTFVTAMCATSAFISDGSIAYVSDSEDCLIKKVLVGQASVSTCFSTRDIHSGPAGLFFFMPCELHLTADETMLWTSDAYTVIGITVPGASLKYRLDNVVAPRFAISPDQSWMYILNSGISKIPLPRRVIPGRRQR